MLSWDIVLAPLPCDMLPWDMPSCFIADPLPMVSCFIVESFDIAELPMVLWDIVSCDMLEELWANAGAANATAIRVAAAKVGRRVNMGYSFWLLLYDGGFATSRLFPYPAGHRRRLQPCPIK